MFFNKKAGFRGLFGFAIIVNVYVGNALITLYQLFMAF